MLRFSYTLLLLLACEHNIRDFYVTLLLSIETKKKTLQQPQTPVSRCCIVAQPRHLLTFREQLHVLFTKCTHLCAYVELIYSAAVN